MLGLELASELSVILQEESHSRGLLSIQISIQIDKYETVTRPVQDPLAVVNLNNRLFILLNGKQNSQVLL